jgi:hypothetical protein
MSNSTWVCPKQTCQIDMTECHRKATQATLGHLMLCPKFRAPKIFTGKWPTLSTSKCPKFRNALNWHLLKSINCHFQVIYIIITAFTERNDTKKTKSWCTLMKSVQIRENRLSNPCNLKACLYMFFSKLNRCKRIETIIISFSVKQKFYRCISVSPQNFPETNI